MFLHLIGLSPTIRSSMAFLLESRPCRPPCSLSGTRVRTRILVDHLRAWRLSDKRAKAVRKAASSLTTTSARQCHSLPICGYYVATYRATFLKIMRTAFDKIGYVHCTSTYFNSHLEWHTSWILSTVHFRWSWVAFLARSSTFTWKTALPRATCTLSTSWGRGH